MMALADFLHDLFATGDTLPDPEAWGRAEADAAASLILLEQAGARDAWHLPGEAPDFDGPTALWAAAWFHEACRVLLRRDVEGEAVVKQLAELKAPAAHDAACAAWSADLVLRHLPEFLRRAVMLSPEDPLVQAARQMAAAWPLSGAGIPGLAPEASAPTPALAAVLAHPTLRRVLADRLIASGDPAWLADAGCRGAVAEALGGQAASLAPTLAQALGISAEDSRALPPAAAPALAQVSSMDISGDAAPASSP